MISLSKIGSYLNATRYHTFTLSIFPALAGLLLSKPTLTGLELSIFCFMLTCILVVHAAANLCNTYFDFTDKVDTKEHNSDPTLVNNILHENEVLNAAWIAFAFSMMFFGSGVVLSGQANFIPYLLFFKGMFVAFNYSGGFKFKHVCLGEITVYWIFGPTIALFVFSCMMKGAYSWLVVFVASPLGLLAASVLLANNIRDAGNDMKVGVRTIPNQLGIKKALNLYSLLLMMPYLQITGLALLYSHTYLLLIWLVSPLSAYFALYPHKQAVTDGISALFERSLSHYHLFGSVYLILLYCCSLA